MDEIRLTNKAKAALVREGVLAKLPPDRRDKVSVYVHVMRGGLTQIRVRRKIEEGQSGGRAD